MSTELLRLAGTDPRAVALVEAMVAETGAKYEPGLPAASSVSPEDLSPPRGGFVIVRAAGEDGGGIKPLSSTVCEIRRLYVVPAARRRGLARLLLGGLEDLARDLGYAVVRLDTGARQPEAQHLFERAGYAAIPDYNGNPYASFWGEKRLAGP